MSKLAEILSGNLQIILYLVIFGSENRLFQRGKDVTRVFGLKFNVIGANRSLIKLVDDGGACFPDLETVNLISHYFDPC